MVVTHIVAVGEERLSGILRTRYTRLYIPSKLECVAHPMFVLISQVAAAVALSLVERNACCGNKFVFAIFEYVFYIWKLLVFLLVANKYKALQHIEAHRVERLKHGQFAH